MWLYPWLSYAAVGGIVSILLAMMFIPDLRSQLYTTVLAIAVLVAVYGAFRRGRHLSTPLGVEPAREPQG